MADGRKISAVFVNYVDANGGGKTAYRGELLDPETLADGELARLERHKAFADQQGQGESDAVNAAFNNSSKQGGSARVDPDPDEFTGDGPLDPVGDVPPEDDPEVDGLNAVTDEMIDALSGAVLDQAVTDAGLDASKGGSLADGSLSADEKRAALKAERDRLIAEGAEK
jgi:hypothetical protein